LAGQLEVYPETGIEAATVLGRVSRTLRPAIADGYLIFGDVVRAVAVLVLDDSECEGALLIAMVRAIAVRLVIP